MSQKINGITSDPYQQLSVTLPDGTALFIQLYYRDSQLGWFFTMLAWNNGAFVECGRRIVTHPNMLRQYKNTLNFGISCLTINNREPTNIQDFTSVNGNPPASALYLLTAQEVQQVETAIQALKYAI